MFNKLKTIFKGIDNLKILGYLNHTKAVELISNSDLLLLFIEKVQKYSGHIPGKLFEYLRARKPIIAFGNDNNEVKDILANANAGMMFGYDESGEEFFKSYSKLKVSEEYVKGFERRKISNELSLILDKTSV